MISRVDMLISEKANDSYEIFKRDQVPEDHDWGERAKLAREKGQYLDDKTLVEKIGRRLDES